MGKVSWRCGNCGDNGTISGWQGTRWDLEPELERGSLVSLPQVKAARHERSGVDEHVIELDVELVSGPILIDRPVSRHIRICTNQTLHELHQLLQKAFDRTNDDAYEFMFGAPYEPGAQRFAGGIVTQLDDLDDPFDTRNINLASLTLEAGQSFGYLFDFGEEWIHRLTVSQIRETAGFHVSPCVLRRVGTVPQAPDVDDWEEDGVWHEFSQDDVSTTIHGPYDPSLAPDAHQWLEMDETERLFLVLEIARRRQPNGVRCSGQPCNIASRDHPLCSRNCDCKRSAPSVSSTGSATRARRRSPCCNPRTGTSYCA